MDKTLTVRELRQLLAAYPDDRRVLMEQHTVSEIDGSPLYYEDDVLRIREKRDEAGDYLVIACSKPDFVEPD